MASLERFIKELDGPRYIGNPLVSQIATAHTQAVHRAETSQPTTEDSTVSIPSSDPESISSSTPSSPSIFSATRSRSTTDSSTSSAPTNDPLLQLQVGLEEMEIEEEYHILPCLLQPVTGCADSFPSSESDHWLSHAISHYGPNSPPTRAMCIFCKRVFVSTDPYECFTRRMNHIADHFEMGCELRWSRPDFGVIRDMYMKGRISKEDFDHAMSHTERPYVDGLRPHDYIPPEIQAKRDAEERRLNTLLVNSRQEDRQRSRRMMSQKKSKSTNPKVVISRDANQPNA